MKCLAFPLAVVLGLAATKRFAVPGMGRYDVMLVYCVVLQVAMVRRGMETVSEFWAIGAFHLLGLGLEIQRTMAGAWRYPDPGLLRIGPVPLFSGFMYGSVASYILQAWRRFDLGFERLPSGWIVAGPALAAYASFFVLPQARPLAILIVLAAFARTWVTFVVLDRRLRMPLDLALGAIGGAIWIGENLGTYLGGWRYPHQEAGWRMVEASKIGAWFLLVAVGFAIVERNKAWTSRLAAAPAA